MVSIKMPKVVDHDQQRERIRRAAWAVFARRGIKGTGLAHVAQAAGVGRSSLYHYYANKESLVHDLAKELLSKEQNVFAKAVASHGRPLRRIEKLVTELVAGFATWQLIGNVVFDLKSLNAEAFAVFYSRVRSGLSLLIVEGQRAGEISKRMDAEDAASIVIGLVDGVLLQLLVGGRVLGDAKNMQAKLVSAVRKLLKP